MLFLFLCVLIPGLSAGLMPIDFAFFFFFAASIFLPSSSLQILYFTCVHGFSDISLSVIGFPCVYVGLDH
jgi:hypothetical protein